MLLFLLSLVGIPPLAGFWAKVVRDRAALQVGGWLTLLAVLMCSTPQWPRSTTCASSVYMYMRDAGRGCATGQSGRRDPRRAWASPPSGTIAIGLIPPVTIAVIAHGRGGSPRAALGVHVTGDSRQRTSDRGACVSPTGGCRRAQLPAHRSSARPSASSVVVQSRPAELQPRHELGQLARSQRGSGGLVTALAEVGRLAPVTWISAAMDAARSRGCAPRSAGRRTSAQRKLLRQIARAAARPGPAAR